jgi:hypothetical protein
MGDMEDLTTHLLMTADELVAALRPELLEEPASERCRSVRARLWVAQIEFHQSDATDDERIDAMELDDDLGAGARRLQAVLIDRPIGDPIMLDQQIPIGREELVVRGHRAGLGAMKRGPARSLAVALCDGAARAVAQPIEALRERAPEPRVLADETRRIFVDRHASTRRERERRHDGLAVRAYRDALAALGATEQERDPVAGGIGSWLEWRLGQDAVTA